jgi:hypothetical protein
MFIIISGEVEFIKTIEVEIKNDANERALSYLKSPTKRLVNVESSFREKRIKE